MLAKTFRNALVTSALALSLGATALAQSAGVSNKKPDNWPSQYKWYSYAETAPQPVYTGPVRFSERDDWDIAIDFDTLPLQHAIVRVHGNGERKMAFITDPTCPYSRDMEREINKLDNVTIYTFVLPILTAHKNSRPLTEQIVCQPDNQARAQAYDNWVLAAKKPPVVASCKHAGQQVISALKKLKPYQGYAFGTRTPLTILDSDIIFTGSQNLKTIKEMLAEPFWDGE